MSKLFGTDGIRGVAGKFPLDPQTVRRIGGSLTSHLRAAGVEAPRLVIGRDTRESGAWIEEAFVLGCLDAGAEITSAGVITTPGVAYLTRHLELDAGVVISASHNPYQDNGIKVFMPSGRKLDAATERAIESDIAGESNGTVSVDLVEETSVTDAHLSELYLAHLIEIFPGLDLSGLKLVLDCANGAAYDLAPRLFSGLGAEVIAINAAPDGRNINRDCGSLHLEGLRKRVLDESADLGIAFDGDADRALFVDGRGEPVDGDATLWIVANYLESNAGLNGRTVVATVMSNLGLEVALRSRAIELIRADVGDKYVLDGLLSSGASIGGEQSGHLIFPELSLSGDGMLTALFLLRVMRETGSSVEQLAGGMRRFPQILKNVTVREKLPFAEVPAIAAAAAEIEQELGQEGRILLRYSGTEPLARIMIEGKDQRGIELQADKLAQIIREAIG
jgi:phosphoglucosamine mutase